MYAEEQGKRLLFVFCDWHNATGDYLSSVMIDDLVLHGVCRGLEERGQLQCVKRESK